MAKLDILRKEFSAKEDAALISRRRVRVTVAISQLLSCRPSSLLCATIRLHVRQSLLICNHELAYRQ